MPHITVNAELPFQSDSDTSHDAAVAAECFAASQRSRYFVWLLGKREHGGTDAEAEHELQMRRSSVCARRNELRAKNLVSKTGRRRGGCTVWVA